jgi:hypothetical protein
MKSILFDENMTGDSMKKVLAYQYHRCFGLDDYLQNSMQKTPKYGVQVEAC